MCGAESCLQQSSLALRRAAASAGATPALCSTSRHRLPSAVPRASIASQRSSSLRGSSPPSEQSRPNRCSRASASCASRAAQAASKAPAPGSTRRASSAPRNRCRHFQKRRSPSRA
eukprot:scaffold85894_cov67-Phaeocystis_antarctica.AAC.14